jgi:hypothetical protein
MQLKIQRSQRSGGLAGTTVLFCLDIRADYSFDEKHNIQRYRLGGQGIYSNSAAKRHLENAEYQLARSQTGTAANRWAGVARGAWSMALAKLQLNITIASLGRGHHIECKDLEELLEAEDTVRGACKKLTRFLQVAETFDGSELVIEYHNGEEQIHVTEHAPPLLEYASVASLPAPREAADYPFTSEELTRQLREFWADPRYRKVTYVVVGAIILILLLRSCLG